MTPTPARDFRTFLIVWATQSVSVLGSALTLFVMTIWLTQVLYPEPGQQRQLALAISAVSIARALASVVAAPIAGVWADRHDRKITMMAMDVANGCLSIAILVLVAIRFFPLWLLLLAVTLSATFAAFHYAAFDTSYVMIVPTEQLPRANAMMQTMAELAGILAPALAAGIIGLPALARAGHIPSGLGDLLATLESGMPVAIALDAVTFFAAAIALAFLHIPSPKRTELTRDGRKPAKSLWADVREGARFIWLRPALLWLLASFTVANFLGSPLFVFQPLLVKFNLAADWVGRNFTFETALALMNTFASLGGVIGGVAMSVWGGLRTRRVYGVLVPMVIAAAAEIVFGLSGYLYVSVFMIFIIGVMIMVMRAHTQAIWQTQTPCELQGRVFAVRRLIGQFTWPLGTALAGWVGGLFNPGTVLAVMGAGFLAFSLLQLLNRPLLSVEPAPVDGDRRHTG